MAVCIVLPSLAKIASFVAATRPACLRAEGRNRAVRRNQELGVRVAVHPFDAQYTAIVAIAGQARELVMRSRTLRVVVSATRRMRL